MVDFSNGAPWAARPAAEVELLEPGKPAVFTMDWELALKHAKASMADYERQIDDMAQQTKGLTIRSEEENEAAVESAALVKKLIKSLEDNRKQWVKGPDQYARSVNGFVKTYREKLQQIQQAFTRKITEYDDYKENERRKAQAAAYQATAAENARLADEAKEHGFEPVQIAPPVVPKKDGPTRTESGTAIQKKVWTWECVDKDQVPEEWKVLDEKRINQAVRAGIREIAGLRIFEEKRTDIRAT